MKYYRIILITGGAGHIGSNLAKALVKDSSNYVVISDNLSTGKIENLPDLSYTNWEFVNIDVNDFDQTARAFSAFSFDYVFHYAATVGVQRTLDLPHLVEKDKEGIENICKLSAKGVKRIFYASSSEVYGNSLSPMREEEKSLTCKSLYAKVKQWGENRLKFYADSSGLAYTVLRFFNTYGPDQTTDFVIPKFVSLALSNKKIPVHGDGKQTRTFCYIDDNIETTLKILYSGFYDSRIINIGHSQPYTISEVANLIIRMTGSYSKIAYEQSGNPEEINHRKPHNEKMLSIIQKPLVSLEEGLKKVIVSK